MSSISNSPSSVRINQNYDPQQVKKQASPTQVNSQTVCDGAKLSCTVPIDDGMGSNDLELDNLEDADKKPLLDGGSNNSPVAIPANKHTEYNSHDGSGNEKVALINNCK